MFKSTSLLIVIIALISSTAQASDASYMVNTYYSEGNCQGNVTQLSYQLLEYCIPGTNSKVHYDSILDRFSFDTYWGSDCTGIIIKSEHFSVNQCYKDPQVPVLDTDYSLASASDVQQVLNKPGCFYISDCNTNPGTIVLNLIDTCSPYQEKYDCLYNSTISGYQVVISDYSSPTFNCAGSYFERDRYPSKKTCGNTNYWYCNPL